jgi:hypothetical protein
MESIITPSATTAEATQVAEAILADHRQAIGSEFTAYRNHVCRVIAFSAALGYQGDSTLLGISAAYHDLAIWHDQTIDYLEPSVVLAHQDTRLTPADEGSRRLVAAMIINHHKIFPYRGEGSIAVNAIRKADWVDVTKGRLRLGLTKQFITSVQERYPNAGFSAVLRNLLRRWRVQNPWKLPPMLRL